MKKFILLWSVLLTAMVTVAAEDVAKTVRNGKFIIDESTENQANVAEGWEWNSSTATLTLDNIRFSNSAGTTIEVDRELTIVVKGHCVNEGFIYCKKATTLQFEEGADLTFKTDGKTPAVGCEVGIVVSLPENVKMQGCYATLAKNGEAIATQYIITREVISSLTYSSDEKIDIDETHYPDEAFRSFLKANIDANGDEKLSPLELSSLEILDLEDSGVKNVTGITNFQNLRVVELIELALDNSWEDLYDMTSLVSIYLSRCDIECESLDVTKWPDLVVLSANGNKIKSLKLGNEPLKLQYLRLSDNKLTEIDLSVCPELLDLELSSNNIKDIDLSPCSKLQILYLAHTNIAFNDEWFSGLSEVYTIDLSSTPTTSLKINNMPNLIYLYISNTPLTSLEFSNCGSLKNIDAYGNKLTKVEGVDKLPSLKTLNLIGNRLLNISLPESPIETVRLKEQEVLALPATVDGSTMDLSQFSGLVIADIEEVENGTLNGTVVTKAKSSDDKPFVRPVLKMKNGLEITLITRDYQGEGHTAVNSQFSALGITLFGWAFYEEIWCNEHSQQNYKAEYRVLEGLYESAEEAAKDKDRALEVLSENLKDEECTDVYTCKINDCYSSHNLYIVGLDQTRDYTVLQTRKLGETETNYIYTIEKKGKTDVGHVEPHKPGSLNLSGYFAIDGITDEYLESAQFTMAIVKGACTSIAGLNEEDILFLGNYSSLTDKIQHFSYQSDAVELEEGQLYTAAIMVMNNYAVEEMKLVFIPFVPTDVTNDITYTQPKLDDTEFSYKATIAFPEETSPIGENTYGTHVGMLFEGKRVLSGTDIMQDFFSIEIGGTAVEGLVGVGYKELTALSGEYPLTAYILDKNYKFAEGDYTLTTLLYTGGEAVDLMPVTLTFITVVDPSKPTSLQDLEKERGAKAKATKVLRNGKLLIIWGDEEYDMSGRKL